MSFKGFLNEKVEAIQESAGKIKLTDELKADITKELHNGYFGAEHRHAIKIKKISDDKYYVLVDKGCLNYEEIHDSFNYRCRECNNE